MRTILESPLRFLLPLIPIAVFGGILFGSAGRWDLPMFWAYLGVFTALGFVGMLRAPDPGLVKERLRPGPGGKDYLSLVVGMPLVFGHLVVAGLDVGRFRWSDTIPFRLQLVALGCVAASLGWVMWGRGVNRFSSTVVRIQKERGHHLITDGPYKYVRHPQYIGVMVSLPCSALALGSWWSLVLAAAYLPLLIRRTVIEDRFLRENLEGYVGYVEKVRYRLMPGLW